MGARVYDPYTGAFLQTDPKPGADANAYGYTDGDPVTETDLGGDSASGLFRAGCAAFAVWCGPHAGDSRLLPNIGDETVPKPRVVMVMQETEVESGPPLEPGTKLIVERPAPVFEEFPTTAATVHPDIGVRTVPEPTEPAGGSGGGFWNGLWNSAKRFFSNGDELPSLDDE
jgi:hypothetical protein